MKEHEKIYKCTLDLMKAYETLHDRERFNEANALLKKNDPKFVERLKNHYLEYLADKKDTRGIMEKYLHNYKKTIKNRLSGVERVLLDRDMSKGYPLGC